MDSRQIAYQLEGLPSFIRLRPIKQRKVEHKIVGSMWSYSNSRRTTLYDQHKPSMQSVPLSEVAPAAESLTALLDRLAYRGVFSAEFKKDSRDGQFKILEINARPWWYVEFASRCGVDVCTMSYRDALDLPVTSVTDYQAGRRCMAIGARVLRSDDLKCLH